MLRTLFGLPQHDQPGSQDFTQTLGCGAAVGSDSLERLDAACRRAVTRANDSEEQITFCSSDKKRTITAQIRRLGVECWICTFEDITSTRQLELRLLGISQHDSLTGLGNRSQFGQSVVAALSSGPESSAAVLFVDLDRFKAINDTVGHSAGDGVLRLVGERIQSLAGDFQAAARLGGDEFAILLVPAPSRPELGRLAKRIVDLLGRTYFVEGHILNVGASAGIAIAPGDGGDSDRLLQSADLALYSSKTSGRGTFRFFEPLMEERANARRKLELELRKALPLRQLEVHYRPQIDVATGQNTGLQAVLRWQHPQRGLMEAEEFESLAQELGLAVQIHDWVLRTACREAATWPQASLLAVSASHAQFETGHFTDTVKRALAESPLPGPSLELEITESVLLKDEKVVLATLNGLRALGVRIAMTDFGTGYASLTQLASFPFDRIRIDRSLTQDRSTNIRHQAIVRAIASLGASLDISTSALGIETSAELARAQSEGCTSMGGYKSTLPLRGCDLRAFFEKSNLIAPSMKHSV
jgi:diguanylate cyclase (GGDEF)-like protein